MESALYGIYTNKHSFLFQKSHSFSTLTCSISDDNSHNNNNIGNFICVLNVQLLISLRIGNLQILLEIELLKRKREKKNQN